MTTTESVNMREGQKIIAVSVIMNEWRRKRQ